MAITLIGGGSRSGKSSLALTLAHEAGPRRAFVATAQVFDEEMRERIDKHREERGNQFETYEEPFELPALLTRIVSDYDAVVVDCLTLWLSNLLLVRPDDLDAMQSSLLAVRAQSRIIFVTNEVGCGIVPENALARKFRDLQGRLNQDVARIADEAYWMAFGCPLKLK